RHTRVVPDPISGRQWTRRSPERSPYPRAVLHVSDSSHISCLSFPGLPICPNTLTSKGHASNPRTSLSLREYTPHRSRNTPQVNAVFRARWLDSSCRCLESVPCLGSIPELVYGPYSGA